MLSFIEKVDIYEIAVDPNTGVVWKGLFNFKPNANDVATAMRSTIAEFDEEVEHEYDVIRELRQTLELVTHMPELLGRVEIAGTYVGEISMTIVKVFSQEEQSMMPIWPKLPHDLVLRRNCTGPIEVIDEDA